MSGDPSLDEMDALASEVLRGAGAVADDAMPSPLEVHRTVDNGHAMVAQEHHRNQLLDAFAEEVRQSHPEYADFAQRLVAFIKAGSDLTFDGAVGVAVATGGAHAGAPRLPPPKPYGCRGVGWEAVVTAEATRRRSYSE